MVPGPGSLENLWGMGGSLSLRGTKPSRTFCLTQNTLAPALTCFPQAEGFFLPTLLIGWDAGLLLRTRYSGGGERKTGVQPQPETLSQKKKRAGH